MANNFLKIFQSIILSQIGYPNIRRNVQGMRMS